MHIHVVMGGFTFTGLAALVVVGNLGWLDLQLAIMRRLMGGGVSGVSFFL